METTVECRRLEALTEDELLEMGDIGVELELDALPHHPTMSPTSFRWWFPALAAKSDMDVWLARNGDGRLVGWAEASHNRNGENPHLQYFEINVRPAERRHGLGSTLLAAVVERADAYGRRLLEASASKHTDAGPTFLDRIGAELRYVDHRNVLWLRDLPVGLVEDWIARAPERAADYELLALDSPIPEPWVERFCAAMDVMNSAPRDGLECDDEHVTAAEWRAIEAADVAGGAERWVVAAVHTETQELAGFTELIVPSHDPALAWQANTGVWPDHRDRGLGRWLKAAMLQRLLVERPSTKRVETWNAGSNEPMLAINHQLGFRLLEEIGEWQVPTETVRSWLAGRS